MKKKIISLMLVLMLVFALSGLTACNRGGGSSEVHFYLWSDDGATPVGFDEVVNEFNNGAGKDLGVSIKFSFDTQSDYKQKLNLSIASGQNDYDVVFDAPWIYLSEFAKKDYYYNLNEFFDNDSYPGFKKAFTDDYLTNNKFFGGVYGIPLTETFSDISVAFIRKDWRIECANDNAWVKPASISQSTIVSADLQDGIDNFNELEYYLYWIKAKKNQAVPALCNNDATWGAWELINTQTPNVKIAQDYVNAGIKQSILVRSGVEATAYIYNGEVMAVNIGDFLNPQAAGGLKDFPAGFNTEDSKWQNDYLTARRWQQDGIISADVMATTDSQAKFEAGLGGAVVQSISRFGAVEKLLADKTPGAQLEAYINDYGIRNKLDGYAQTDFKAWNFLCIPKTVPIEKRDKAMKFMNWLFESRENHDMFQYGIKGKHWDEAKDDEGNVIPNTVEIAGMEAYGFPAYQLTWNPTYIRVQNASDPKIREYSEYMYDINRYVAIPYSEFTFDPQRTPALASAVNNATLSSGITQNRSYYLGQIESPVSSWNNVLSGRYGNSVLQEAMRTIQGEIKYQLQEYLDRL